MTTSILIRACTWHFCTNFVRGDETEDHWSWNFEYIYNTILRAKRAKMWLKVTYPFVRFSFIIFTLFPLCHHEAPRYGSVSAWVPQWSLILIQSKTTEDESTRRICAAYASSASESDLVIVSHRPTYVEVGPLMTTRFGEVRWSKAGRQELMIL